MQLVVKTNYTKEGAEEFFRFHLLHRTSSKYIYFSTAFVSLVAGILLLTVVQIPTLAGLLIVLAIAILLLRPYQTKKIAKKIIKDNPIASNEYTIIIDEEKIIYKLDQISKQYSWNDILVGCEAGGKFYLYITKNMAIIIPLYTIEISKQGEFRTLIKQKTKYRKYLYRYHYEES